MVVEVIEETPEYVNITVRLTKQQRDAAAEEKEHARQFVRLVDFAYSAFRNACRSHQLQVENGFDPDGPTVPLSRAEDLEQKLERLRKIHRNVCSDVSTFMEQIMINSGPDELQKALNLALERRHQDEDLSDLLLGFRAVIGAHFAKLEEE